MFLGSIPIFDHWSGLDSHFLPHMFDSKFWTVVLVQFTPSTYSWVRFPFFKQIHGFDSHFSSMSWVRFPFFNICHCQHILKLLEQLYGFDSRLLKINKKVNNKFYCLKIVQFENNNGLTNCKKKYTHIRILFFSRPLKWNRPTTLSNYKLSSKPNNKIGLQHF